MARNRIIYASQSVWINGEVLYRVQSLGTTSSFTSEDVFQLGQLDIIDVVDDVPAVAVTLNTNDFGDVKTLAVLAQIAPAKLEMADTATSTNANLVSGSTYLHGVALADFAVTCGNLTGVTLWAPVQDECSIGTLANNIDQTLFLDRVYVNSFELSYTTGANATENYGAETDNKRWFLNEGRFINFDEFTVTPATVASGCVNLSLAPSATIAEISTGIGFLRTDDQGAPAISHYDNSENNMSNVEIIVGDTAASGVYVYEDTGAEHKVWFPTSTNIPVEGDRLQVIYSADAYAGSMNTYFTPLEDPTTRPADVGALRQGQIEVYVVDPDAGAGSYTNAWRLTGATISADLTREPLAELGHLAPYDRPLTLPIPITLTVDSTAGDLENWARFAGKHENYLSKLDTSGNLSFDDIAIKDLMTKGNLVLVVKVFEQTDEEAGGTGSNRKVLGGSSLDGKVYFDNGVRGVYDTTGGGTGPNFDKERALKTVIVKNLKITDEGMTLDLGSNATQTFGFRSNNDLFLIKGDVSYSIAESTILRNA